VIMDRAPIHRSYVSLSPYHHTAFVTPPFPLFCSVSVLSTRGENLWPGLESAITSVLPPRTPLLPLATDTDKIQTRKWWLVTVAFTGD
jgi:hypothetical protein